MCDKITDITHKLYANSVLDAIRNRDNDKDLERAQKLHKALGVKTLQEKLSDNNRIIK